MFNKNLIFSTLLLFSLLQASELYAQKSKIHTFSEKNFYKGFELYENEKYGAARHFFNKALQKEGPDKSDLMAGARFYRAMCAVELFNNDAEFLVLEFVNKNPESSHINEAWFRLADYMYKKKNYSKALEYYDLTDRFKLNEEQLSQYYFHKGFSYYKRNDFENARVNFYEIKDKQGKYSSPALYYYSHIHYEQENYQTSLEGFTRLLDDKNFSSIAPYYVAQIYYLQGKFEELTEFVPSIMDEVNPKREGEMSKILGEAWFYLGEYDKALPYLLSYSDKAGRTSARDKYQLAYTWYKAGEYKKASRLFEKISMRGDELSQSALYHLADCYLRMGEKQKARSSFGSAANMDHDPAISEDALFNFAKLTYELSFSPFNEAIRDFNTYIIKYPSSERTDEVYNYLVTAYMNTRNYRMAMESLEKIKSTDPRIERAYQRVAFFRGLELFTNQRYSDAILSFDKSLGYGKYDDVIRARTLYWLAETYVRENDNETAISYYDSFLDEPASVQTPEYKKVNYSKGYLAFNEEAYGEAEKWFLRYINLEQDKKSAYVADAYNRLGDCRFILRNYWPAIEYYDKVINLNKADVDYAYFQKGFTLGLVNRPQRKIETLNELISAYPSCIYIDDALFELGRTYVLLDDHSRAKQNYERLTREYPSSGYMSKTLTQLGLIEKNTGNNTRALEYYKKVINDYPGSPEASIALRSVKDIYVGMNQVDTYLGFVDSIGEGVSVSEQDSLMYAAAENLYLEGDCDRAVESLRNYLDRFSEGAFMLNAHYYLADCLLKNQKGEEAFASLIYIIEQPHGLFTEPALVAAARISFDREDYHQAADLYRKLIDKGEKKANIEEAEIRLMRAYDRLNEYSNTIEAANQVLVQDKPDPQIQKEANYLIASSYLKQNDPLVAYNWFDKIDDEVNSQYGAEAKYRLAEIDFNRGKLEEAEKTVYEMIDLNTPHQYWMGKTFLLLAAIFVEKDDDFQAAQTLESIVNYYTVKDDGIVEEATRRKLAIADRMNARNSQENPDTLEINIDEQ